MNCLVHSIDHYTAAQSSTQVLPYALISFVFAGQIQISVGTKPHVNPGPYLTILPQGTHIDFQFTEQQDQWLIALDLPGLMVGHQSNTVELVEDHDGGKAVLPMFTPIVKEHISGWEGELMRMRDAFTKPSPANRMRVQTGVGNIILYVIDQHPVIHSSAAAKLRWLIDEDMQASRSLEEISRECGYSTRRMRLLFEREYGQSPQTYRNKRRMHLAVELLSNSDLRIKEISERVGCHHVSHFCALFRSTYAMPPTHYQRKFRQK